MPTRALGWVLALVLFALGMVTLAASLALGTHPGTAWLLARVAPLVPGTLSIASVEGTLMDSLRLREVSYDGAGLALRLRELELVWSPPALLAGTLRVARLALTDLDLTPPPAGEATPGPPQLPNIRLPLAIRVDDARLHGLVVRQPQGESRLDEAQLSARADAAGLQLQQLSVAAPTFRVDAHGSLQPEGDYPLRASLRWSVQIPEQPSLMGEAELGGTLRALRLRHRLEQPGTVRTEGELDLLAEAPQFDLKNVWEDLRWPPAGGEPIVASPTGSLTVRGTLQAYQLRLQAAVQGQQVPAGEVQAEISGDLARVQVQRLRAETAAGTVTAAGSVQLDGRAPVLDLAGDWQALRWPWTSETPAVVESARGSYRFSGPLEAYQIRIDTELQGPEIPAARWQLEASGDLGKLRLSALTAEGDIGKLEASGDLAWSPALRWQAQLGGSGLDPGRKWPDWPGRLSLQAQSDGGLTAGKVQTTVKLQALKGELRGYALSGEGGFSLDGAHWQLEGVALRSGSAELTAAGGAAQDWDLKWQLSAPNLAQLLPQARGQARSSGSITGPIDAPRVQATLSAAGVAVGENRLDSASAEVDLDITDRRDSRLRLQARGLSVGGTPVDSIALDGSGRASAHRVQLQATAPGRVLRLETAGGWSAGGWRGTIQRLDLEDGQLGPWRLERPVGLEASADAARLGTLCLARAPGRLCAEGSWAASGWKGNGRLEHIAFAWLEPWLPEHLSLGGELAGEVQGSGQAQRWQAQADLRTSSGRLQFQPEGADPIQVDYQAGSLALRADPERVQAEADLPLANGGGLSARVGLLPAVGGDWAAAGIDGQIKAGLPNLDLVAAFAPGVEDLKGKLDVDLALAGTVQQPALRGAVRVEPLSCRIVPLGVKLSDGVLAVTGDDQHGLRLSGRAKSGQGEVQLGGNLALDPAQGWPLELTLKGKDFEAVNIPEARATVSPDLQLSLRGRQLTLNGSVLVPQAAIKLRELPQSAVTLSPDVVVVTPDSEGAAAAGGSPFDVAARLELRLGDKVTFSGFGLDAELAGAIRVREEPDRIPMGTGELRIVKGTYKAYGQDLTISRGRLIFAGPVDNPGLDVRATRTVGDVTAGLQVSGTAKASVVTLFSDPRMQESEVLSYLLLGRPLKQASGSDSELLMGAVGSLGLKGGDFIAKQLGGALGLDDVSVQSEGSLDTASLVLGRYLTPKLYLSYGIGLFEPSNSVRMRYELTRRLTLQATGGTESGMDVIYTIEK